MDRDLTSIILLVALLLPNVWFCFAWGRGRRQDACATKPGQRAYYALVGMAATFLDTFTISSFATTTPALRRAHLVDDRLIPGTLNVGYVVSQYFQAAYFVSTIKVDLLTLSLMIASA